MPKQVLVDDVAKTIDGRICKEEPNQLMLARGNFMMVTWSPSFCRMVQVSMMFALLLPLLLVMTFPALSGLLWSCRSLQYFNQVIGVRISVLTC